MFTITPLLGGGTLVEGSDVTGAVGRTILVSDRWDAVKSIRAHQVAEAHFDEAVTEFFKPITDAAEVATVLAHPTATDWSKVTITEETEGVAAETISLDMDGILLRMLEETDGSALRWVGEDVLVAIA